MLLALNRAIEPVTNFMYEPDADDEQIHTYLRELAAEQVSDELTRLLLRDPIPASHRNAITDDNGIEHDTLIAAHDELAPDHARLWYASLLSVDITHYDEWMQSIPHHMSG